MRMDIMIMQRGLSQYFFHRFSSGQLIHQLVKLPYFLHQRILDGFYLNAADFSGDQIRAGIISRRAGEKISICDLR